MSFYAPDQITVISVTKVGDATLKLKVKPMMETLYYSPGVKINSTEEKILLGFVRCKINDKCEVDQELAMDAGGIVSLSIDSIDKNIYITNYEADKRIYSPN